MNFRIWPNLENGNKAWDESVRSPTLHSFHLASVLLNTAHNSRVSRSVQVVQREYEVLLVRRRFAFTLQPLYRALIRHGTV